MANLVDVWVCDNCNKPAGCKMEGAGILNCSSCLSNGAASSCFLRELSPGELKEYLAKLGIKPRISCCGSCKEGARSHRKYG